MNNVILKGRLYTQPRKIRVVNSPSEQGKKGCCFVLKVQNSNGYDRIDCRAFGKTAEFVYNNFSAGDTITVTGELRSDIVYRGLKHYFISKIEVKEAFFSARKLAERGQL